jgi:hypothetical protein
MACLTQNEAKLCKNLIKTLVLLTSVNIFRRKLAKIAENRRKSPKIAENRRNIGENRRNIAENRSKIVNIEPWFR